MIVYLKYQKNNDIPFELFEFCRLERGRSFSVGSIESVCVLFLVVYATGPLCNEVGACSSNTIDVISYLIYSILFAVEEKRSLLIKTIQKNTGNEKHLS